MSSVSQETSCRRVPIDLSNGNNVLGRKNWCVILLKNKRDADGDEATQKFSRLPGASIVSFRVTLFLIRAGFSRTTGNNSLPSHFVWRYKRHLTAYVYAIHFIFIFFPCSISSIVENSMKHRARWLSKNEASII